MSTTRTWSQVTDTKQDDPSKRVKTPMDNNATTSATANSNNDIT